MTYLENMVISGLLANKMMSCIADRPTSSYFYPTALHCLKSCILSEVD